MRLGMCLLAMLVVQGGMAYEEGSVVKRVSRDGAHRDLKPLDPGAARAYGEGFTREGDTFVCENSGRGQKRGVHWSVTLNQSAPVPVRASARCLVERAEPGDPGDFSLYLDIQYTDGSCLWGQLSGFAPDAAQGWQRREVLVFPEHPIKAVNYYLLFRNRAGKVTFKEPCFEQPDSNNAVFFDTLITETVQTHSRRTGSLRPFGGESFLLRDVAAGSDIVAINSEALGVKLNVTVTGDGTFSNGRFYDVSVKDLTGKDRALTLYFTRPLSAAKNLQWCGSFRGSTDITSSRSEYMSVSRVDVGANGFLSKYPLAAVSADEMGFTLGLVPSTPLVYRLGCQAATCELYLACDIGLTPEKPSAHFRIITFNFPGSWGLRGAFYCYYERFSEAYKTRIARQGGWMAFEPISKLEGSGDFGFRFKEGIDEVAWDDAHDILSFRYTEPLTWWMKLEGEKSIARGAEEARRLAESGNESARAWVSSCFHDEQSQPPGRVLDTPWCNGVAWSMNGLPGLAGEVTEFSHKWKPDYVEKTYGQPYAENKGIDGEYIDSAEAYVTAALDFRRDHFAAAERPLCYSLQTRRVGVFKGMMAFEYVRAMAETAHGSGRYMMANSTPHAWPWLAPLLDVMGTEENWKQNGKWTPTPDETMMYRRALCKGKPYCFLMNTDFSKWTYEDTERFMQACVAYGMFPGFFSEDASTKHYFKNPDYFNRDRPLFKKYMPLCKRVAEAGWEPLTGAVSENPAVLVERFGEIANGGCLTVYNPTAARQSTRITFKGESPPSRDLVSGTAVISRDSAAELTLEPYGVAVLASSQ